MEPDNLSRAIVVWSGKGRTARPDRNEQRLVDEFGPETAAALMPHVRVLVDDFYASDASNTVADLHAMGSRAADDFRRSHPEVSDEAVDALVWCYTFDWK